MSCSMEQDLWMCRTAVFLDQLHDCPFCQDAAVAYLVRLLKLHSAGQLLVPEDEADDQQIYDKITQLLASFTRKQKQRREIPVGHRTFVLRETDFDVHKFACKTWSCSVLFSLILDSGLSQLSPVVTLGSLEEAERLLKEAFEGKQVLEIGAGTGLAGIALKQMRNPHVLVQTDYMPSILENISWNASLNTVQNVYAVLDWRRPDVLQVLNLNDESQPDITEVFDVMVGTDICYDVDAGPLVANVLDKRLKDKGIAFILLPKRRNFDAELHSFEQSVEQCISLRLLFRAGLECDPCDARFKDIYDQGLEEDFVVFVIERVSRCDLRQ